MAKDILFLWLAALPLMGSPGPATLSVAGVGTAFGFRVGMGYLCGIIMGTVGVLIMIATGITALVLARPSLLAVLTLIAGAYILYLAWKIATAPPHCMSPSTEAAPSFVPGFILAIANPKAFAAIGAVYSGHRLVDDNLTADSISKIIALSVIIVIVNTVWLAFGATFSRVLTNPVIGRAVNTVFAVMLVMSVALAFLTS